MNLAGCDSSRRRGTPCAVAVAFGGFPGDAFGFCERLEADNFRRFWDAHKAGYQRYVRVVAGGGAAGLSGALALARSRRSVLVAGAGSPRNSPAGQVHNVLTRDGTPPAEIYPAGAGELARGRRHRDRERGQPRRSGPAHGPAGGRA